MIAASLLWLFIAAVKANRSRHQPSVDRQSFMNVRRTGRAERAKCSRITKLIPIDFIHGRTSVGSMSAYHNFNAISGRVFFAGLGSIVGTGTCQELWFDGRQLSQGQDPTGLRHSNDRIDDPVGLLRWRVVRPIQLVKTALYPIGSQGRGRGCRHRIWWRPTITWDQRLWRFHHLFQLFGVQPHRTAAQVSTDPFFVEKLRDVVGLASVHPTRQWCFASMKIGLDRVRLRRRCHPRLPAPRYHHAVRRPQRAAVIFQCTPRHRFEEFRAFVTSRSTCQPGSTSISSSINYATHMQPKAELGSHAPYIHSTPSIYLFNQAERFFALTTQCAIRRGSFEFIADLVKKTRPLHPHPQCKLMLLRVSWYANSILQKLARLC